MLGTLDSVEESPDVIQIEPRSDAQVAWPDTEGRRSTMPAAVETGPDRVVDDLLERSTRPPRLGA